MGSNFQLVSTSDIQEYDAVPTSRHVWRCLVQLRFRAQCFSLHFLPVGRAEPPMIHMYTCMICVYVQLYSCLEQCKMAAQLIIDISFHGLRVAQTSNDLIFLFLLFSYVVCAR